MLNTTYMKMKETVEINSSVSFSVVCFLVLVGSVHCNPLPTVPFKFLKATDGTVNPAVFLRCADNYRFEMFLSHRLEYVLC